jgi:hypothetical protein
VLAEYHRKVILCLITFAVTLTLSACSASRETPVTAPRQQPTVEIKEKGSLIAYESSFRPADYDEDVEIAEKRTPAGNSLPEVDTRKDSVSVEEEIALGFRIQIFASAKIDEANMAKQSALETITTDSLYVVYDPPVYKVRVGDYTSRFDANKALAGIIQNGYPDAWVVNDRIIKRKITIIPREED